MSGSRSRRHLSVPGRPFAESDFATAKLSARFGGLHFGRHRRALPELTPVPRVSPPLHSRGCLPDNSCRTRGGGRRDAQPQRPPSKKIRWGAECLFLVRWVAFSWGATAAATAAAAAALIGGTTFEDGQGGLVVVLVKVYLQQRASPAMCSFTCACACAFWLASLTRQQMRGGQRQGLTLAHHRDTSLTLQLDLSTFGTHPRVNLGYMGDRVSLS
jgi:hypothetical protein